MGTTKAEFARLLGVSPSNVSRWIRKGIIKPLEDGTIDLNQATEDLRKNRDPIKRFNWRMGAGKPLTPDDEGKPPWATGNRYRDLETIILLHFHEWVVNRMTPILIKLLKELHPNDILAKSVAVLDSIKRGELVREYLAEGVFEREMNGSLGDGTLPKNVDVRFPESIVRILKDRKVNTFVFGEEE